MDAMARGLEANGVTIDEDGDTLIVHGLTDLVTPYFETQMTLDQIPNTGDPARMRFEVYPGGHMFYSREDSRARFRDDARALIEGPRPRP